MLVEAVWFAVLSGAILVFGHRLAADADRVGARLGLNRTWIGLTVLAALTSAPELVNGVSAVRGGWTDIALGDILGSLMVNLLILAGFALAPTVALFQLRPEVHARAALQGGLFLAPIALAFAFVPSLALGWVSWWVPIVLVAYAVALVREARQRRHVVPLPEPVGSPGTELEFAL